MSSGNAWRKPLLALLCLACAGEAICRWLIGLGQLPLYQSDERMEYQLVPSQVVHRFHQLYSVNRYGMRADDFPPRKSDPAEFRVLVIGDSVVNGSAAIDQAAIATALLQRSLAARLRRPVVVGNASAKSWGPPNELAWLQAYGTLDADVVVLELSSHDYADAPSFIPVVGVSAEYPARQPVLALQDLFVTYLLPQLFGIGATPAGVDRSLAGAPVSAADIAWCARAERDIFRLARARGAKLALMQHLSRSELSGGRFQAGYYANQEVARDEQVPWVDDAHELQAALAAGRKVLANDGIHLRAEGQGILAGVLQRAVDASLMPAQAPASTP